MLSGQIQKWTIEDWSRDVDAQSYRMEPELNQTYRIVASKKRDTVWICTADFRRVVKVVGSIRMPQPSFFRHNSSKTASKFQFTGPDVGRHVGYEPMSFPGITWAYIMTTRRENNRASANSIEHDEQALVYFRSMLGEDVAGLPERIQRSLLDWSPWTYRWLA